MKDSVALCVYYPTTALTI